MKIIQLSLFVGLTALSLTAAEPPHRAPSIDQAPAPLTVGVPVTSILNQTPDQSLFGWSDAGCGGCSQGAQVIAENVLVNTGGVGFDLDQIVVWGVYANTSLPPVDNFSVLIHADSGGLPGTIICSQTGLVPTSRIATGNTVGSFPEYMVTLDLATACHLTDGTHWIEVFNNTDGEIADWGWESGNTDPGNGLPGVAWSTVAPGASWANDPSFNAAIQLNGTLLPVELQSFSIE